LALLPHCPYSLYSNLVWANWERLEQVVFIGNSLEGYILRSLPNLPTIPLPQEILQPLKLDIVQEMFGLISEQSRADPKSCSKPLDGASDPDPGVDMRAAKARSDTVKTESDALSAAVALPVDCIALVASAAKEVPLHKSEYFKIPGTSRPLQGLLASHMECAFNDISLVWFPISEVKRLSARPSESALDLWNLEHCPEMS
jgi:hypothetical protein